MVVDFWKHKINKGMEKKVYIRTKSPTQATNNSVQTQSKQSKKHTQKLDLQT